MRNVIVTGIPRSGTTLASALIDSLPDCVCLNEPYWQTDVNLDGDPEALAAWLKEDFTRIRSHLLAGHPVPDRRQKDGKAFTDFFTAGKSTESQQPSLFTRAGLSKNFILSMKHNALYLAALPCLARMPEFTIIALIRHPVATIASWHRLTLPISSGRMPHAENYWPELKQLTIDEPDILVRQVKFYDLMCQRLHELRETIHVLPYEKLAATPDILCSYLRHNGPVDKTLVQPSQNNIPQEEQELIKKALQNHGISYRLYYPHI